MSIATDEALRRWPEIDTSTGGPISQSYAERYEMRREGFVAGAEWQASREPTEAEIKAAITEWDRHGYCSRVGDPIVCMCGAKLTDGHGYDVYTLSARCSKRHGRRWRNEQA